MSNLFSSVPTKKTGRHRNHLTPVNESSFNFAGIYPILCKTVLPGDKWSVALQCFVRSVPLLSPVMHNNDIKVDAFFVPMRLIWKSAEDWHKCVDETIRRPQMYVKYDSTEAWYNRCLGESSLADYLGFGSVPFARFSAAGVTPAYRKVCALPFRAYRMIYDYYFRNKALDIEATDFDPDFYGDNDWIPKMGDSVLPDIMMRSWRRDIFTSALPDPQNGSDVLIPQGDIVADGNLNVSISGSTGDPDKAGDVLGNTGSGQLTYIGVDSTLGSNERFASYNKGLKMDTNGPTMRQLRYAEMLEEFEEAQARGGSAKGFKEWLRNIWNVRSSDARLDRPEYLGGYRGPIQISEVPQTSSATATSPQGTLAGKGLSVGGNRLFRGMYFEEPGIVMVTMSVVPKSAYMQGDPREWLYESCFDFPNPYFDHLGEQEVKAQELMANAQFEPNIQSTWGYNVRNYEMKSFPDEIHGALRSTLAYWHEGRIFDWANPPGLTNGFTRISPADVARIFPSSETSDKLIGQFFFDIRLKRNLSWYGLPKFS